MLMSSLDSRKAVEANRRAVAERAFLTGKERTFLETEVIVSKTDLKGRITYANDVFLRVSGYAEEELIGAPHSILRHPDMPRCVFKFLWDRIQIGREVFAYVVNKSKNGDHYWVFAHVTPTFDADDRIVAYHSNRRVPKPEAVAKVVPLYRDLVSAERAAGSGQAAVEKGTEALLSFVRSTGMEYDELIFAL